MVSHSTSTVHTNGAWARPRHRRRNSTGSADVVVLEHHGLRQVVAVVVPTARLHSRLLKNAQARRGLARVHQHGLGALELLGHGVRVRGDAAHALQEVERHPLAGKQHARIAAHGPQQLAGCDLIAIRNKRFERRCGVEQHEGALKHIQTRNDARRLCVMS